MENKAEEKYDPEINYITEELLSRESISIARVGGKPRWHPSVLGDGEYDGDSLYARFNQGENYKIVDGEDLSDVGSFQMHGNTFRNVQIGEDPGFMVAYSKFRDLKQPDYKDFWLKLLIGNKETHELQTHNLFYQRLNEMISMPLFPQVNVDGQNQEINYSAGLTYNLGFDTVGNPQANPKKETRRNRFKLGDFGASLDSVIKELDPNAVKSHVMSTASGYGRGLDYVADMIFPGGRDDFCFARHITEDGSKGLDTVYAVWLNNGNIQSKNLVSDSRYVHIDNAYETKKSFVADVRMDPPFQSITYPRDKINVGFEVEKEEIGL